MACIYDYNTVERVSGGKLTAKGSAVDRRIYVFCYIQFTLSRQNDFIHTFVATLNHHLIPLQARNGFSVD